MQGAASRIDASLPVSQCFHGRAGRCELGGEGHVARDRYRAGIVGIAIVPSHEIVLPERYGDKGRRASLRILSTACHISHRLVCGIGRNRVQDYSGLPNVGEIVPILGLGIFRLTARRDIECHGIVVEGRYPYLGRHHGFGSHVLQTSTAIVSIIS